MKRLLLFVLAIICSLNLMAQLEVKDGSFKEVSGFVNINTEKMYDDNDKPYAVLKIKTENISSKERHELNFGGDAQTFWEVEYRDGEVWLYISYYATFLKISHEELSSTEFHFPFDMKPKCGYELTLVNKTVSNNTGSGSLSLTTQPENGATISLNGKILNQKTPYVNEMLSSGKYEITVKKKFYESVTRIVDIKDGDSLSIDISMPRAYGSVRIESEPSEADVFIDDNECGTTPVTLNILQGSHVLKLMKSGYRKLEITFVLDEKVLNLNEKLDTIQELDMIVDEAYEIEEEEVFVSVEENPEFPGGPAKLLEYIQKNLKYPMMARESNIQGKVFVQAIIERDGSISNVKVLNSIGGGCDEEAVRVVQSLPTFDKPGKIDGKPVRVLFTIPITFALQ